MAKKSKIAQNDQRRVIVERNAERRAELIHEQKVIVNFERERAVDALAGLLPEIDDRQRAVGQDGFLFIPPVNPSKDRFHPLKHLFRIERFRKVVVGTSLEPLQPILHR